MKPDVSVIIPAYNSAATLPKAVESALAQKHCEVEVVVVDDKSTDDTRAVAQGFNDPRVRVLLNEENRGISHSRNRAIEAAQGEWVAVLDADDWYTPERLVRLLSVADEEGADVVADDQYLIRSGEATPFTSQFRTAKEPVRGRLLLDAVSFIRSGRPGFGSLQFGNAKAVMRRSFLNAHGLRYDEELLATSDNALYLHCLLQGARFVVVPEAYYYRLRHDRSITAKANLILVAECDIKATKGALNHPLVLAQPAVAEALRDRLRQQRRHAAFRYLQRALRSRNVLAAVKEVVRRPEVLSFIAQKLAHEVEQRFQRGGGSTHRVSPAQSQPARTLEPM